LSIFKKVLSVGSGKLTSELNKIVEEINSRESSLEKLTDEEIKTGFLALSDKIDGTPHSIEVEAFAFVREAAKRSIGQRHYDVQLFGRISTS
jgi:preprotein translocase subunit SecA